MTDVSNVVTQLDNNKTLLQQVITATPGGFDLPAATAKELVSILEAVYTAEPVYPNVKPKHASNPSAVYTIGGVDTQEVDGYRITQTDLYRVVLRAGDHVTLDGHIRSVITGLAGSAYSAELLDMQTGYEDEQSAHWCSIDIEFTYVIDTDGTGPVGNNAAELPAAIVYPVGRGTQPSAYDNLVKQIVEDRYAITLVTADGNIPALISEVQGILLGFQQVSTEYFDMQYESGSNLGGVGNMELWREIYFDRHAISE